MGPGDLTIRAVEIGDEAALGLVRHLFRAYASEFAESIAGTLCFQGFDAELDGLPGRYAAPSGCLLLATSDGRPAGCVGMRDLGGGTSEMKRLYVEPGSRGRGLGDRLVDEVILRARRAGHRRMVLDTMPEMARAIALYRARGFVPTDRYWNHPVDRAVFLEKSLDIPDP